MKKHRSQLVSEPWPAWTTRSRPPLSSPMTSFSVGGVIGGVVGGGVVVGVVGGVVGAFFRLSPS